MVLGLYIPTNQMMKILTISAFVMSAASLSALCVLYSTVVPKVNKVVEKVGAFSSLPSRPIDPSDRSLRKDAF